ncbi:MAG: hypothetical protein MK213_08790, partial [Planctomycetes bacterium]|nr:hypothetical protein [Planctomycetota bacterium]
MMPLLPTALLVLATPIAPPLLQDPLVQEIAVPDGVVEDSGDYLLLRFDETDEGLTLREFIKIAQINTNLNFTIDDAANATTELATKRLLLYGTKRIKKEDFFSFFQIMMKIYGYVCVQQGSGDLAVVVITKDNAQTRASIKANMVFVESDQIENFSDKPGTYIATVYRLRFAQAQSVAVNLRTAVGTQGSGGTDQGYTPLPNENAILIQGFGPWVAAAVRILNILDVEPFVEKPEFLRIKLDNAGAEEVAELVDELLSDIQGNGPGSSQSRNNRNEGVAALEEIPTKIIPNLRDNSLLIVSDKKNVTLVRDLIAELDRPVSDPETNFHLYQLQNISAVDLEEALGPFLTRTQQAEERNNRSSNTQAPNSRGNQEIIIEPQEETNTLLVTAPKSKWEELKRLLDQLDRRQPQVLIETALIEVSEDFNREIGFEYANVNYPEADGVQTGFGFTSMGISTLTDSDGDGTLDTRILDPDRAGFTAGILDGTKYGIPFLLAAAQSSTNANILSVPSVLVSNNRQATVESTDEVPTGTSQATSGVGVTTGFGDYVDAGIKLSISPSISAKEYLRLNISLEISTFRGAVTPGATIPPQKATRKLTTSVYLPDGATMWIGGIVRDDLTETEQGIPFLSDLPMVGWMFGSNANTNIKTTLFFFCTPSILDDEDFAELSDISHSGKNRAADVIGVQRIQRIDPTYQQEGPLDVILDVDLNGDGIPETGLLDLSTFATPVFEPTRGELDSQELRMDAAADEVESNKDEDTEL